MTNAPLENAEPQWNPPPEPWHAELEGFPDPPPPPEPTGPTLISLSPDTMTLADTPDLTLTGTGLLGTLTVAYALNPEDGEAGSWSQLTVTDTEITWNTYDMYFPGDFYLAVVAVEDYTNDDYVWSDQPLLHITEAS
jgi:hypothetical protein